MSISNIKPTYLARSGFESQLPLSNPFKANAHRIQPLDMAS